MKKIILSLATSLIMCIASAQVSKTIDVATAGSFRSAFIAAGGNKTTTTNLTVTGKIDARDVKFMRDSMPVLAVLDLEVVQIKAYNGTGGTDFYDSSNYYPANELPQTSFVSGTLMIDPNHPETPRYITNSKTSLISIKLPSSLISIGYSAFSDCSGLTCSLKIPNSLKTIGDLAFNRCNGLSGSLIIPNSVISIGSSTFAGCSGFTGELLLSNSITSLGDCAFIGCTGFTGTLVIPNSFSTIFVNAFQGFTGISSLAIPGSVNSIGFDAFRGCYGIQKITVNKVTPFSISENAFSDVDKTTCELIVPMGSMASYQAAEYWKDFTHITEAIFVTLDTRGGNPAKPITTTLTNSTITEPDIPVRDGYSFVGWYKEAACTNAWDFAKDIVTTPVTLYAKWTQVPVSIVDHQFPGIRLYPNPATTTLNLGNLQQNAQISIFSMDGKLVKQQNITTSESTIDIEDFPKGVYLLKVNNKEINMVQKFIKQ